MIICLTPAPLPPSSGLEPHTPSLDEDGINLEENPGVCQELYKIRRLSTGLTQTQVGQALALWKAQPTASQPSAGGKAAWARSGTHRSSGIWHLDMNTWNSQSLSAGPSEVYPPILSIYIIYLGESKI